MLGELQMWTDLAGALVLLGYIGIVSVATVATVTLWRIARWS